MSEIDRFARTVLTHRFPDVTLLGDFRDIRQGGHGAIDVLIGGTPCQSFSVAGLRGGLADERGNLALEYLRLADRLRPRWIIWENVPGVLSQNGGRDFGAIIGGLGELGYGFAYRVLDAQYFQLAQRRQRVFVVGHLGDWRPAAAVLFEPTSLRGNSPPRRKTGTQVAALTANGAGTCGADDNQAQAGHLIASIPEVATALCAYGGPHGRPDSETETFIAHTLRADGFDASEDGTGRGTPIVPVSAPLCGANGGEAAKLGGGNKPHIMTSLVRRLTPRECERLMGFPDDFTLVPYRGKPASDGPCYRAIGNSIAVPVLHWIGRRIAAQHYEMERAA